MKTLYHVIRKSSFAHLTGRDEVIVQSFTDEARAKALECDLANKGFKTRISKVSQP